MSTLAMAAIGTVTGVIGAAAMYVPARLARYDAATYVALAEEKLTEAEQRDAEFERTRNLPWHYATEPAAGELEEQPEPWIADESLWAAAALQPVNGEVLHVEHATGEIPTPPARCCDGHDGDEPCDPATYALPCCGNCPEWATRTRALSDQPHHDDEDAPHDDTERPYLWVLIVVGLVVGWGAFLRGQVGALMAHLRKRRSTAVPANPPYRGRHWVADVQHTGQIPVINIPAQRDGGEDR